MICYDIESDKLRKKISDRLIADGLERVQYSVCMGPLTEPVLARLVAWLEAMLEKQQGDRDGVLVISLQAHDMEKMLTLGKKTVDADWLQGKPHTLIL